MSAAARDEVESWLEAMQQCVRSLDYERARTLFAGEVRGYGTRAASVDGLDELERTQWRATWPTIRDFTFELGDLRCYGDDVVAVVVRWSSRGIGEQGTPFDRPGRATLVLRRQGERLVAVHSHFSLDPR